MNVEKMAKGGVYATATGRGETLTVRLQYISFKTTTNKMTEMFFKGNLQPRPYFPMLKRQLEMF